MMTSTGTLREIVESLASHIEVDTNALQVWSRTLYGEFIQRGLEKQDVLRNTTQRLAIVSGVQAEETYLLIEPTTKPVYLYICIDRHDPVEGMTCFSTPFYFTIIGFCFDWETSGAMDAIQDFWSNSVRVFLDAKEVTILDGQFMSFPEYRDIQAFRLNISVRINTRK